MHTQRICSILIILCVLGFGFHALDGDLKVKQILGTKFPIIEHQVSNLQWPNTRHNESTKQRIEFGFWISSNHLDQSISDGTGYAKFMTEFKATAKEVSEYTRFTPHYMTWRCPERLVTSRECRSRCIHRGRYCNWEFINNGYYEGKDVVVENLRQACFFKAADEIGKPWLWWDYVEMFGYRCSMNATKFNKKCADGVIRLLDIRLDIKKIDECIGDPDADVDHPILKADQEAQIGQGSRGPITILPTLVVNNRQYRGKLQNGAVLKAICGGLKQIKDRANCLVGDGSEIEIAMEFII